MSTSPGGGADGGAGGGFDPGGAWCLDERVALRPEAFGALLYHYGTRRLSFLKSARLAAVVASLGEHPSAAAACAAAGVEPAARPAYERALAGLAASAMIRRREPGRPA